MMIELEKRVEAFEKLGEILRDIDDIDFINDLKDDAVREKALKLNTLTQTVGYHNGWFTPPMVITALRSLGESLQKDKLEKWLSPYKEELAKQKTPKTVAVIMAGNVPAVGFHDFLSVLISGNRLLGKLSSEDDKLLKAISEILTAMEPGFEGFITLTGEVIKGFDAVIATGSNNSARYFEYYFGKYPGIIRKNRNGVAVLTGRETEEELQKLTDDIFLYYGLGCRNVARLFVPKDYDFNALLKAIAKREEVIDNHKYFNNYEYNKAIFLVNNTPHFDTGNLLLTENNSFASPVSVLYYSFYEDEQALRNELMLNREHIQCVVSSANFLDEKTEPGKSQSPELWDYADGVDTIKFLMGLHHENEKKK
jgi:hypothetical protein